MDSEEYNQNLRPLWRKNWLIAINELTCFELQEKSWLDKNAPSAHWSFVEFMCSYFDDLALDRNYEDPLKRNLISKQEFQIVEQWHKELDQYRAPNNDDYNVVDILKDIKWQKIIEQGLKTKSNLANVLETKEQIILTKKIDYQRIKTIANNA